MYKSSTFEWWCYLSHPSPLLWKFSSVIWKNSGRGFFLFKTHLCAPGVLQLQKDFVSTSRRAPTPCFGGSPGWLQGSTETQGRGNREQRCLWHAVGMCSHLPCEGTPLPTAAGFISVGALVWYQTATLWMSSTRCLWAPWLCSSTALGICFLTFLPLSSPSPPSFYYTFSCRRQYRIGLLFISITFPCCDWICGN